ncbi:hypothetical protein Tco_0784662 [Tanacetum coccineum]
MLGPAVRGWAMVWVDGVWGVVGKRLTSVIDWVVVCISNCWAAGILEESGLADDVGACVKSVGKGELMVNIDNDTHDGLKHVLKIWTVWPGVEVCEWCRDEDSKGIQIGVGTGEAKLNAIIGKEFMIGDGAVTGSAEMELGVGTADKGRLDQLECSLEQSKRPAGLGPGGVGPAYKRI